MLPARIAQERSQEDSVLVTVEGARGRIEVCCARGPL
jgi:hypothetical protein